MKRKIRNALLSALACVPLPERFWVGGFQFWAAWVVNRKPKTALRILLAADERLQSMISYVGTRYEKGAHPKHRLMQYHRFFIQRIENGERVVDIGCGFGEVSRSIVEARDVRVLAVDIDPSKIEQARKRNPHSCIEYVLGDATRGAVREHCDVVVISNCLEHIEQRVRFIREAQQSIGASRWLIRVPCYDRDWKVPLRQELGMFPYCDDTHFTEYTKVSFEKEMEACGMRIEHLRVQWGEIWAEVHPIT